jgi:hypothetical protein
MIHDIIMAAAGQLGGGADANFENTVLLLHGDGTNGAQNNTFLDSSTNALTISRVSTPTQGTFSPFSKPDGSWGTFFDGTDDYLIVADNAVLRPGAGAFTLEAWIYRNAAGAAHTIYAKGGASTGINFQVTSGNVLRFTHTTTDIDSTGTIPQATWTHVAVVREGTGTDQTKLYINGVNDGQGTVSTDFTQTEQVRIGTNRSAGDDFNGHISNVRFVKGSALYTGNFTPSTSPFTTTSQGASSSEVELLTCQSNRFLDNSTNAFAVTRSGSPLVTPFSPFPLTIEYDSAVNGGGGYLVANGVSGPQLNTSTGDTELAFGTGDFTTEAWVYFPSTLPAAANCIYAVTDGSNTSGWNLYSTTTTWGIRNSNSNVFGSIGIPITGVWNHIAWVRTGSSNKFYLNGVEIGSATNSNNWTGSRFWTGYSALGPSASTFYISNIRMIKGQALTSGAFTPPTGPLQSGVVGWTGGNVAASITGTESILLNFTNAGIFDNTGFNAIETVADAQIDTTTKKYGTGSIEFDGTGDWLIIPDSPDLKLGTGKFTIEFWVYLASGDTGSNRGLVGKGGASTGWLVSLNTTEKVVFTYASSTITSSGAITTNAWNHIAVVREGTGSNETKIYIGGTNDGTGTVSTDFTQTEVMYIGANRTAGDPMKGFIDDLRITKGIARYTTTFTPPNKALPNIGE